MPLVHNRSHDRLHVPEIDLVIDADDSVDVTDEQAKVLLSNPNFEPADQPAPQPAADLEETVE